MSTAHSTRTRCEFTQEIEKAAIDSRNKAAADWESPLAPIYAQVAQELQRVLMRHARRCPVCLKEDGRSDAAAWRNSTDTATVTGVGR